MQRRVVSVAVALALSASLMGCQQLASYAASPTSEAPERPDGGVDFNIGSDGRLEDATVDHEIDPPITDATLPVDLPWVDLGIGDVLPDSAFPTTDSSGGGSGGGGGGGGGGGSRTMPATCNTASDCLLPGTDCCNGKCKLLDIDPLHCGSCFNVCGNQTPSCCSGKCVTFSC